MKGTGLEVWPEVLAHLKQHHPTICRRWFAEELKPAAMSRGTLSVRTQSTFHRDYLSNHCSEQFTEALQSVTGHLMTIKFIGPDELLAPEPPPSKNGRSKKTARGAESTIKPAPPAQPPVSRAAPADSAIEHKPPAHLDTPPPSPPPLNPPLDDITRAADEKHLDDLPASGTYDHDPQAGTLVINPDYGFDSFVEGPSNRLAHAAALAVARNPATAYNPLFIHGDVGLGKTHLLQAICLSILQAKPDAVVCYLSCEGFMTQFMQAVRASRMIDFRNRFRDVDILVVDDIHYLGSRDRTQEEFFHTFNTLYHSSKQIVLSSDAPPELIPDLHDRLVSRFKWGLVASVEAPSFETRIEILKAKAAIRGFTLPDEVAFYIAQHVDSHVRELEGQIIKLHAFLSIDNRPIDLDMAREALSLTDQPKPGGVTIHTIIETVIEQFDIRLTDLQSKLRTRSVVLPRQVCMYLAKHNTHLSLKEIGGYFGGRDHSTVLHAVTAVEKRRASDEQFNATVKALDAKIQPKN